MRRTLLLLSVLSLLLVAFAPVPAPAGLAATCRVDGAVVDSGAVGVVTCTDVGGDDFVVDVTVTLQQRGGEGWQDVASERCGGESSAGQASIVCEVVTVLVSTTTYRALVDIESPRDVEPVELRPTNQGAVHADALADDECGVNEAVEQNDGTTPDAPWADICAVTMTHELTAGEDAELASISLSIHVAGMLDSRPETTAWGAKLKTDNCIHTIEAADAGATGTAGVRVRSECNPLPFEPCEGINAIIHGEDCRSFPGYADNETAILDATSVSFTGTGVVISVPMDALGALASEDLVVGRVVRSVDGQSSTGVGSSVDGTRAILDVDFAWSNGRSYTLD